ncbi:MAG: right-handed parallel beta-helix repeat-containing protein [Ruminococcaceae bacterium]|nr:right-handed parallel beta-helix repeat-containing protein [Oscillospiraceae bacterium]
MAITLYTSEGKRTELTSLAEVRAEILTAAKSAAEADRHDSITVELGCGKHALTEPFFLSKTENPELDAVDITLRGEKGKTTVHSHRTLLGKDMTPVEGKPGVYTYQFPKDENGKYPLFHELCVNGSPVCRTKSPVWINPTPITPEEKSGEVKKPGFYVPLAIAKTLAEGDIGSTELMMCIEWEFLILHVASVDLESTLEERGQTYALVKFWEGEIDYVCEKSWRLKFNGRNTWFQNSPAFLSEPGTYAYDYKHGVLSLFLRDEDVLDGGFSVEYPTVETLIHLEGVANVTLENLNFMGVTSKYVCENLVYAGQANNLRGVGRLKTAAVLANTTRTLTVRDCSFLGIGTNGVQVFNYSAGTVIENCTFKDVGMSAVTVGNPSWHWEEKQNRTFAVRIENNYMNRIACDYLGAPAIFIGQVDGLQILHNTVIDCSYSAVSIGWSWSALHCELGERTNIRDAEVAYNYFENFMDKLRDGGAVYVLGGNCHKDCTDERFNRMHHNFAYIHELREDSAKYGYYLDESSSNWEVSDSVVINIHRLPIYSQWFKQSLTYHNTFKNIYSTTPRIVMEHSHVPERDVVTENYVLVEEGPEALFEKYPEARAIRDGAGAHL